MCRTSTPYVCLLLSLRCVPVCFSLSHLLSPTGLVCRSLESSQGVPEPHLNTYTAQQFRRKYSIVLHSRSTCNIQNKYKIRLKSATFKFFWPTNNTSHSLITKKYQNYMTINNRNLLCTFASISKSYFHVLTTRLSFLKVTPE